MHAKYHSIRLYHYVFVYLLVCLSVCNLWYGLQSKPKKPTKSFPAEEKEVFVFIFNVYTITLITALVQIYIIQSLRLSTKHILNIEKNAYDHIVNCIIVNIIYDDYTL